MTDPSTSQGPRIVIPLAKIDQERRLVIGRAAQEVPDKQREMMDYAASKPAFLAWSQAMEEASGGRSKGNLRAMHSRHVAGKIVDITFDDNDRAVDIVAKVIDPVDWEKCLQGAYTGFSIGGGYASRWKEGDLTKYVPRITEISLVDSPCIPSARFAELVKADGVVDRIELVGRPPATFGAIWPPPAPPPTFAQSWPPPAPPATFGAIWPPLHKAARVVVGAPPVPFVPGATSPRR